MLAVITFDDGKQRSSLGKLWEVVGALLAVLFFHIALIVFIGLVLWLACYGLSYIAEKMIPFVVGVAVLIILFYDWLSDRRTASAVADQQVVTSAWEDVGTFVVVPVMIQLFGGHWDISMLCYAGNPHLGRGLYYDISAAKLSDQNGRISLERKIMKKLAEVYNFSFKEMLQDKAVVVYGSILFIRWS